MAGAAPMVKLEDEVLRKFYRSFHKHGPGNWAKMAKDTKISVEQCEMLHKQHMSFLSLPATPDFETAFLALVNDHYNSTLNQHKEEVPEEGAPHTARATQREPEEQETHVNTNGSQKPRRTPKPTPQRLAAEEEMQARRLARSNQGTPKSARAKMAAKPPPSPTGAEWTSSQRKRSRKLFEESTDADVPRYRSPMMDRWRGRHNTDVDEGVDALLSLASGAHPSSTLTEHPSGADGTTAAPDADDDVEAPPDIEHLQATPKRPRGPRGGRSTPTPTGTPVKGAARAATASASADAAVAAAVLRSPKARGGAAGAVSSAATTSGRGGSAAGGRLKKELRASPTSSAERQRDAEGGDVSPLVGGDAADGGPGGAPAAEGPAEEVPEEVVKEEHEPQSEDPAATISSPAHTVPSGRPVRKRKPTAIALAAVAAAEEEDAIGGRGARGVVAAIAAAVAATGVTVAEPLTEGVGKEAAGSSQAAEMLSSTAALLATVPPVRTRASSRIASGGPGSRRALERQSPAVHAHAHGTTDTGSDGGAAPEHAADETAAQDAEEPEAGAFRGPQTEAEEDGAAAGPSSEAANAVEPPVPSSGRGRGKAGAGCQMPLQASAPSVRLGPSRGAVQSPPGRRRKRKSLPERLTPMFESFRVPAQQGGSRTAASAPATSAAEATAPAAAAAGAAPDGAAAAAAPEAATTAPPAAEGASSSMPAGEVALRHCLGPRMRRWCMYEFFYSALDRPWFMRNELMEFCMHMQLPMTKLTRYEWGVLRSALGRPRRLSLAFLRDERLRLEGYREHARLKYDEVAVGMEVPSDCPRQLRVGQEVTARHPVSRQLYDGTVLTVKGTKYRVQFHRKDLMTEVVRDTELMPLDPHEYMPLHVPLVPPFLNGRPYDPMRLAAMRGYPLPQMPMGFRPMGPWSASLEQQLMKEQDAAMLADGQRALDVKEGLVAQLTQLNNEAAMGMHTDENGACSENFQLQYTRVVLQLKETNAALEGAMSRLQGRQQQVIGTSAQSFGPLLAQQQQQLVQAQVAQVPPPQQQQQLAVSTAVPGAAAMPGGPGARGSVPSSGLSPALQQAPQAQAAVPPAAPSLPPLSGALTPAPAPAESPTAGACNAASPQQQPTTQLPQQEQQTQQLQPQPQARATTSKGSAPGQASAALPSVSQSPPLVVPPPRGSTAAPAGPPAYPGLLSVPSHPSLQLPANPEQLVEHAFIEARAVVDTCRGRSADGLGPMLQPRSQSAPVIAPVIAMQMQPAGGAPVPVILPPGTVLPQPVATHPPDTAVDHRGMVGGPNAQQQQLLASGVGAGGGEGHAASLDAAVADGQPLRALPVHIKVEESTPSDERPSDGAAQAEKAAEARGPGARHMTEEEVAENWLREVIVGCVGMLFTIQKCTAGNVAPSTVGEALDLAVKQLQGRADGENEGLYRDIVQSVHGLKAHLTRPLV